MRLDTLNALDDDAAARELLRCCGSTAWAARMAAGRPFSSVDQMLDTADSFWNDCTAADWLEAFAAHPRIRAGRAGLSAEARADGTRAKVDRAAENTEWSSQEQSGARDATDDVRERLARGNRDYEARFGYIFIVCATGKSAGEMLAALERRLRNPPDVEVGIAAGEQRQITRLRLLKLLGDEQRTNR
jgi:2-oxo-4-hydroxy-4-carboxy-5-ureidoimidazoline decarboxylase